MTVSISAVHVLVDDPDAALGFYRDILGLKVRNGASQPWGARDFAVRDPAGNHVRIEQGLSGS